MERLQSSLERDGIRQCQRSPDNTEQDLEAGRVDVQQVWRNELMTR